MTFYPISDSVWPIIMRVQSACYPDLEPEDLSVLKSKWQYSPDSCFVVKDASQQVQGYLLAHPWQGDNTPKLNERLPERKSEQITGEYLYLHDLAIAPSARSTGVASQLVQQLCEQARAQGYQEMRLTAVQNAQGFWRRFGFKALAETEVCTAYGDDAQLMVLTLP